MWRCPVGRSPVRIRKPEGSVAIFRSISAERAIERAKEASDVVSEMSIVTETILDCLCGTHRTGQIVRKTCIERPSDWYSSPGEKVSNTFSR